MNIRPIAKWQGLSLYQMIISAMNKKKQGKAYRECWMERGRNDVDLKTVSEGLIKLQAKKKSEGSEGGANKWKGGESSRRDGRNHIQKQ